MNKLGIGLLLAGIVGCSVGSNEGIAPAPEAAGPKPLAAGAKASGGGSGRVLIVYRSESSVPADAAKKIGAAGGTLVQSFPEIGVAIATGPSALADKLSRDGAVLAAGGEQRWSQPTLKPRWQVPGLPPGMDLFYGLQWNIRRVNAPQAWANVGNWSNVTVAVIDTGVDYDHPEFGGGQQIPVARRVSTNISSLSQVVPGFPTNCDGAGVPGGLPYYPTGVRVDVPSPTCVEMPLYVDPHGTHVAGIVGANGGDNIVRGVAPGVKIAAYKVFDRFVAPAPPPPPPPPGVELPPFPPPPAFMEVGFGASDAALFTAIIDSANHHDGVINMSLGGLLDRNTREGAAGIQAWSRVIRYANKQGTVVVAAKGNENQNLNGTLFSIPSDVPGVISVGATGTSTVFPVPPLDVFFGSGLPMWFPGDPDLVANGDVRAAYSNVGGALDISAPGGDCGPAFDDATGTGFCNPSNLILSGVAVPFGFGWNFFAGTSMASPHVAAVAALVRAKYPALTTGEVKERLKATAQKVGSPMEFGAGVVDAAAATAN
jgi:lantibiotic leader peptide-processing serine protease